MRKVLLLFALLLLPLMAFYGCSGSGTGLSADTSTDTGTVSKTGSLTVSAKFPQNGNKGEIGTALIDENTATIEVFVETSSGGYSLSLTPSNPTGTIANIPVGSLWVSIYTYDSANIMLDYLYLGGEIVEGQNTLTATLIRGSWQLVDSSNNPTSITLSKTLSTDTTTLNRFSVIPSSYYYAKKSSIDPTKNFGWSEYNLLWKGSGFSSDLCGATETCQSWLGYLNQFMGPSTNNNSIADGEIPLPATSGYVPTEYEPTNRWAFFGGGLEGMNTFSDPDALNYFNSRVTGATTMEGNILEILAKSDTWTETCKDLSDNPITCPWDVGVASKSKKGLQKSITKAMSQRLGKAVANANGCFIDLNVTGADEWEECADLDGDGIWCEPEEYFKVVETWDWTGDACGHSFKAVGSQLPSTDLGLIIQKTKK